MSTFLEWEQSSTYHLGFNDAFKLMKQSYELKTKQDAFLMKTTLQQMKKIYKKRLYVKLFNNEPKKLIKAVGE